MRNIIQELVGLLVCSFLRPMSVGFSNNDSNPWSLVTFLVSGLSGISMNGLISSRIPSLSWGSTKFKGEDPDSLGQPSNVTPLASASIGQPYAHKVTSLRGPIISQSNCSKTEASCSGPPIYRTSRGYSWAQVGSGLDHLQNDKRCSPFWKTLAW